MKAVCRTNVAKPSQSLIKSICYTEAVGMDLFEWRKLAYLAIVDFYSRFIKIAQLDKITAEAVILFARTYSREWHVFKHELVD